MYSCMNLYLTLTILYVWIYVSFHTLEHCIISMCVFENLGLCFEDMYSCMHITLYILKLDV